VGPKVEGSTHIEALLIGLGDRVGIVTDAMIQIDLPKMQPPIGSRDTSRQLGQALDEVARTTMRALAW